jgi:Flp pilus assembly protein TadG
MNTARIGGKKGEQGSYIVEFGLSFVLFFGMILGILDVSRGIYAYSFLAGAAKEGSRYAMIHGSSSGSKASSSDVQGIVQKWLIGMVNPASATVTTTWSPVSENPGSLVSVKVQYTYTPITSWLVGNWTLQSNSQAMVVQ